jgi:hypothetical protein
MDILEAVEILSETHESLYTVALGLPVDANEAAEAFADAIPDTTEYICLKVLTAVHPVPVIEPTPEE